jgi:hypothetical protein
MTKKNWACLITSLLLAVGTRAQAPFTGTVIYQIADGQKEEAHMEFIAAYNKHFILLQAIMPEKTGDLSGKTLAMDFVTGNAYEISHKEKIITQKHFTVGEANEIQLSDTPIQTGRICGLPAKAYRGTINEGLTCTVWLADSLPLAVPAILKRTNDLFIWGMDRLLLRITAESGSKGFLSNFEITILR